MKVNRKTVTIANGAALSTIATLGSEETLVGIEMPSAWTAASMTLVEVSSDGTNKSVYQSGSEFSLTVSTDQYHVLDPIVAVGIRKVAVRSGTTSSPVNQGAARTITLITAEI